MTLGFGADTSYNPYHFMLNGGFKGVLNNDEDKIVDEIYIPDPQRPGMLKLLERRVVRELPREEFL